jgi:hypothetical protein
MNIKLIPVILINLILIISIIFFDNDARTIILLFLIELLIFTIFRSIRLIKESEKTKKIGTVSERTGAITSLIFSLISIPVFILIVGDANNNGIDIIIKTFTTNIWIVLSIIVIEIFSLIKYFMEEKKSGYTFSYSAAKLFLVFGLLMIVGPTASIINNLFGFNYSGLPMLAVFCVLGKTAVDYWVIKKEEAV